MHGSTLSLLSSDSNKSYPLTQAYVSTYYRILSIIRRCSLGAVFINVLHKELPPYALLSGCLPLITLSFIAFVSELSIPQLFQMSTLKFSTPARTHLPILIGFILFSPVPPAFPRHPAGTRPITPPLFQPRSRLSLPLPLPYRNR